MAKIVIEYRHGTSENKSGRRNVLEMRYYLERLADEMMSAGIDTEYIDSANAGGDDVNSVSVNGRNVITILDGLEIKIPEGDDCDPDMRPKMVIFERPVTDWDKNEIEDIPDVLMKNAISKAYADANRTE